MELSMQTCYAVKVGPLWFKRSGTNGRHIFSTGDDSNDIAQFQGDDALGRAEAVAFQVEGKVLPVEYRVKVA